MPNTITIELSAEDRARLDRIGDTLERLINKGLPCFVDPEKAAAASVKAEAQKAEEHPVENPFQEMPAETPVPFEDPKPEEIQYKLADVQQKVVQLSAGGKKAETREIVKKYAEKVSEIPVDKFAAVMAELSKLEG